MMHMIQKKSDLNNLGIVEGEWLDFQPSGDRKKSGFPINTWMGKSRNP